MNRPLNDGSPIHAGYVRRSSEMQKENYSIDAQKRGITDAYRLMGKPAPVFYEDDERSARGEQIAKRPAFKRLMEDIQAGRVQTVMVHSFDRWSRNVMVTLQSFRILADHQVAFISLSEHIDYSTPEGRLQLTILAAFAAYFSDMLAKHTSKGKSERAAQGLHNGDIPFGYRHAGAKEPPAIDPDTNPGLRMIGELRMRGVEAEKIADEVNAAGYRTGSKRYGQRLFTRDTINAILRNEFYAAYAPEDDRGTIFYKDQRHQGRHQATFTYEEWRKIREVTESMHSRPKRASSARRTYELAGYIADIQCGLTLRVSGGPRHTYYRDVAKTRRLPCPTGGDLLVRTDLVRQQFGDLLKDLTLPENWRVLVQRKMQEAAESAGVDQDEQRRERERLKLKKSRTVKLYREGYIDDKEFQSEIASVELLLKELESPHLNGVRLEEVVAAGERLPDMAVLWEVATPEERREMVMHLLEQGGLYYDLEKQAIVAIRPHPAFRYILRMIDGIEEKEGDAGLLLVKKNCQPITENPSVPLRLFM
jgi:DNA invertase Pin-like site-specific DNA recombinase